MSISDPLMFRYYELLTDEPLSQIESWKREVGENKINPRDLKARLAKMIVSDFWSRGKAEEAAKEFDRVHKYKKDPTILKVTPVRFTLAGGPVELGYERPLIDIMMKLKIFSSRGEAKRVIQQGGIYLDGRRIEDINYRLNITEKKEHILKIGKRKFFKFILS
jgi:tyrosyl-tRNA synthetase